jgi:tetratricopeptide (TPR) repeat protein
MKAFRRDALGGWRLGVCGILLGLAAPVFAAPSPSPRLAEATITYPLDGTVFPPEIIPPTVRWTDNSGADTWTVSVHYGNGEESRSTVPRPNWKPETRLWEEMKRRSVAADTTIKVAGYRRSEPKQLLSQGQTHFRTSSDAVGAPIFYREVILPFIEAVKDPAKIRWRFGAVSDTNPRVVLENLPACGNCHSFPKDASVLAMDVDYANSKGSYIIAPISRRMPLRPQDVITWDDYRRGDGEQTFGFLSQISPDGQVVASTVKDRSVFVPKPGLDFSQLFFPIKGIVATYDRRTKVFRALPGADNPDYVQSNPSWSPDGKYIVFARAPAYQLKVSPSQGRALLTPEECAEFLKDGKPFRFDLYRIPYNQGQGGTPQPLAGASDDGFSHFFARYSPDGKWIVFCRARNYMLLQPDSELWIVPAEGGQARRLRCNTTRMNSWHSWSPNGHWLVFSSKVNGPYTQLFLTHMDAQGHSSPPVELAQFTAPDRAANIPEFVSLPPDGLERIEPQFLNDYSYARAGFVCEQTGDIDRAIENYTKALRLNPENVHAHERLGYLLCTRKGNVAQGLPHCREAVRLRPDYGEAHFVLGCVLFSQGDTEEALAHFRASLKGLNEATDPAYTPMAVHSLLGSALLLHNDLAASAEQFREAVRLNPQVAEVRLYLAIALARQGLTEEPLAEYRAACRLKPELDQTPDLHDLLSLNLAKAGRFQEAVQEARKALAAATRLGNQAMAQKLAARIQTYEGKR